MDNFINITYAQFVDKYVDKFIGPWSVYPLYYVFINKGNC